MYESANLVKDSARLQDLEGMGWGELENYSA